MPTHAYTYKLKLWENLHMNIWIYILVEDIYYKYVEKRKT